MASKKSESLFQCVEDYLKIVLRLEGLQMEFDENFGIIYHPIGNEGDKEIRFVIQEDLKLFTLKSIKKMRLSNICSTESEREKCIARILSFLRDFNSEINFGSIDLDPNTEEVTMSSRYKKISILAKLFR